MGLGTIVFDLSYQDMFLGTGSADGITLNTGTNDIALKGVLVPQSGTQNLTLLSQLFTSYLNHEISPVKATGRSAILASDGSTVSWLSDGLQSLVLNVPFQSAEAINPIHGIEIGQLSLDFSKDTPWAPVANSNNVTASLRECFSGLIRRDAHLLCRIAFRIQPQRRRDPEQLQYHLLG